MVQKLSEDTTAAQFEENALSLQKLEDGQDVGITNEILGQSEVNASINETTPQSIIIENTHVHDDTDITTVVQKLSEDTTDVQFEENVLSHEKRQDRQDDRVRNGSLSNIHQSETPSPSNIQLPESTNRLKLVLRHTPAVITPVQKLTKNSGAVQSDDLPTERIDNLQRDVFCIHSVQECTTYLEQEYSLHDQYNNRIDSAKNYNGDMENFVFFKNKVFAHCKLEPIAIDAIAKDFQNRLQNDKTHCKVLFDVLFCWRRLDYDSMATVEVVLGWLGGMFQKIYLKYHPSFILPSLTPISIFEDSSCPKNQLFETLATRFWLCQDYQEHKFTKYFSHFEQLQNFVQVVLYLTLRNSKNGKAIFQTIQPCLFSTTFRALAVWKQLNEKNTNMHNSVGIHVAAVLHFFHTHREQILEQQNKIVKEQIVEHNNEHWIEDFDDDFFLYQTNTSFKNGRFLSRTSLLFDYVKFAIQENAIETKDDAASIEEYLLCLLHRLLSLLRFLELQ